MTKPSYEEFCAAYYVIMAYIDTEPNSRSLFHALVNFRFDKMKDREEI